VIIWGVFWLAALEIVAMLTEHDGVFFMPVCGLICMIIGAKSTKIKEILNRGSDGNS